jgi:hypothetical protein
MVGNIQLARNAAALKQHKDLYLGFVWAKMPLSDGWQRFYARVQNSCIYFCKSVETNDFQTCYVIYNATIQIMRLRVGEWDGRVHRTLLIKHDFDMDWLLLALEEFERDTLEISARLELKALEFSKESMAASGRLPDQTNRYSFGKI